MGSIKIKSTYLSLILLFASIMPIVAEYDAKKFEQEMNQNEPDATKALKRDCDEGGCVIKADKIKAGRVLARCLEAGKIETECIDADHVRAYDVSADLAYLAALCTQTICANQFVSSSVDAQTVTTNNLSAAGNTCLTNLSASNACFTNLTANSVCITGTLFADNIVNCEKVRAYVSLSAPTTYTLGNPIPFDVIQDDPNGNISFSPTRYTAPVSGYYIVSAHTDLSNLQNSTPILGSPIAILQIQVNGVDAKEVFHPFLAFLNDQKAFISSIIRLNAGDVVTSTLDVAVIDQTTGFTLLTGTVDLDASSISPSDKNSFFAIHLLSENCPGITPCTPCDLTPCTPSTPLTCGPCTSLPSCPPCNPCVPCNPCQCP
jgi:hypothetical protein